MNDCKGWFAGRFSVFAARYSAFGSRFLLLGVRFSAFGSRYLLLGVRFSVFAARFSAFGSRFSLSGRIAYSALPRTKQRIPNTAQLIAKQTKTLTICDFI